MTVNILPTRTWNRLGMNESQIQIEWPEESVLIKPERLAAGVTWEKRKSPEKSGMKSRPAWDASTMRWRRNAERLAQIERTLQMERLLQKKMPVREVSTG